MYSRILVTRAEQPVFRRTAAVIAELLGRRHRTTHKGGEIRVLRFVFPGLEIRELDRTVLAVAQEAIEAGVGETQATPHGPPARRIVAAEAPGAAEVGVEGGHL